MESLYHNVKSSASLLSSIRALPRSHIASKIPAKGAESATVQCSKAVKMEESKCMQSAFPSRQASLVFKISTA
ncbi:hypothetical protein CPter291_1545 [Collimonas pratensis]|uniref:Uncharacterized protein n=1 Tax=Collimonas pratensis TaxID=279113 RepID=A0ABM5Z3S8_9BURK|nr:hypothetical protein CPter291_1545 [Collimonas pratensis]